MTKPLAKSGMDVHLTVHLAVHRHVDAGVLFSGRYKPQTPTTNYTTGRLLARSARPLPQASAPSGFAVARGHSGPAAKSSKGELICH